MIFFPVLRMKRVKREDGSNSMDRVSELPKVILHRILYFLPQEDAVRTSVLSKSWRNIWRTRPKLEFSDATFNGNIHKFTAVVNNTIKHYCDQRMSVEEFHVSISLNDYPDHESGLLLAKWIALLTNMGLKKFCLSIRPVYSPGNPSFYSEYRHLISLPRVVLEAESLQDLYVERFMLDHGLVLSKHLKKLHLHNVNSDDDTFQKIISSCPLIETMLLESCQGFRNIKVNNLLHLKSFSVSSDEIGSYSTCKGVYRIKIYPPSLETINITCGHISCRKGSYFRNLNHLSLFYVNSSLEHLSSCKFPSLKRLSLYNCDGLKESQQLFIDAPNIAYFRYDGDFVPSISFATTLNEWKSDIYLRADDASSSCFLKLNELLKSLRQSTIFLNVSYEYPRNVDEDLDLVPNNGCDKPTVVESLNLICDLSYFSSLLNRFFLICRPRNLGHDIEHMSSMDMDDEFTWKILMQRESEDQDQSRQLWMRDLEGVRMEIYNKYRKVWFPITVSELQKYQRR